MITVINIWHEFKQLLILIISHFSHKVCGLKWSHDHQYLASGGNDNKLFVWNMSSLNPVQTYTDHLAAVKAIAWSPHQHGLLASGGGTADRCIRFWNTLTAQPLQCVDTGSQVCNLAWSKHSNELVRQFNLLEIRWYYLSGLFVHRSCCLSEKLMTCWAITSG